MYMLARTVRLQVQLTSGTRQQSDSTLDMG